MIHPGSFQGPSPHESSFDDDAYKANPNWPDWFHPQFPNSEHDQHLLFHLVGDSPGNDKFYPEHE